MSTRSRSEQRADRIRGCLYGLAMGDALGIPAEWKSADQIRERWPSWDWPAHYEATARDQSCPPCKDCGYKGHVHMSWAPGDWSDDTEQGLCVLDAWLDGGCSGMPRRFTQNLDHWFKTNRRGCGRHTRAVLTHAHWGGEDVSRAAREVWEASGRTARPNGAVMRTPAVALLCPEDVELTESMAAEIAKTTHFDPLCVSAAVFVTGLLADIIRGDLKTASTRIQRFSDTTLSDEVALSPLTRLDAETTPALWFPEKARLDQPGCYGHTIKPVQAAIWVYHRVVHWGMHPHDALRYVIRGGGDTDTNAAIAGAVIGAFVGLQGLPRALVEGLKRDELDRRLDALLVRGTGWRS